MDKYNDIIKQIILLQITDLDNDFRNSAVIFIFSQLYDILKYKTDQNIMTHLICYGH